MIRSYYWLNSAGGPTEPTGLTNIHVTKSPGTLPPRRARRIRSVKTPARRNIHTSKSPHGLLQRNPEIHSRVQIAAVHAHEHDPAEHSIIQIPGVHATEHSPEEHSHCQMSAVEVKCFTRDNGIGLGLTTRCAEPLPVREQRQR